MCPKIKQIKSTIKFINLWFTKMKILVYDHLECIDLLTSINLVCNSSLPFPAYNLMFCNLLHTTNIVSLSIIQALHTQISSCSCNFSNWTINASITLSSSSFKAKYHDLITFFNPLMDLQHKWTSMDLPYNSSQKLDSVQIDPHEDEAWIKIYIANLKSGLYFFTQSYSGGCTCF